MKNTEAWKPTKYVLKNGRLIASRNPADVGIASRLYADVTASFYGKYLHSYAKGSLIDLGCGNVPLYQAYKDLVTEITCVDWSNSLHHNQYVDVSADLNNPLPLGDSQFDTIILSDVLEHIAQPETIWKEMARILKPNGCIFVSVPFFYKIHEAPYDYFRYTEFALRNFATRNQLEVLELHPIGGFPEVLADLLAKNTVRLPFLGKAFARVIQKSVSLFGTTGYGNRISRKSGKVSPMGYFMVATKKVNQG